MGQAIPNQHPAVVLRSHYNHLRALLAVAMIAAIGLTVAVVILANDHDDTADTISVSPTGQINGSGFTAYPTPDAASPSQRDAQAQPGGTRYDGGPEEGTRGALSSDASSPAVPGTRYDDGPEEGTRGPTPFGGQRR
jgi:hypothetical protein